MKKLVLLCFAITTSTISFSQTTLDDLIKKGKGQMKNGSGNSLSNDEVVSGLKEALTVGSNKSSAQASKADGFYKNPAIKIPFPPEAKQMESTLKGIGMTKQVDKFTMQLNRAAELAAKDAAPIFVNAIKSMSIADGFTILKGANNAASTYLKDKTNAELTAKFKPIVASALKKVAITKYWNPLVTTYNKVPGAKKQNPNLEAYVTQRAIEGLFKLVADEELKIRKDPASRVSDLLKKVFG
jgi:hypothetical protein